jgi:hypothetical protein
MERTLTQDDLKAIGQVIDDRLDLKLNEKLDKKFIEFEARIVPEIVKQVGEKVVAEVGEMIDENILPEFDRLENTLVTKSYLDDKLAHYVPKPF